MDAFIGEIRPFAFGYVPEGWLACDGNSYNPNQYQALYSIIGTKFGGSLQQQTFKVPNLLNLVVLGVGQGPGLSLYNWGVTGGSATVTLDSTQFPPHNHAVYGATGNPTTRLASAKGAYLGNFNTGTSNVPLYSSTTNINAQLNANSISSTGSTTPVTHNNQSPSLALIYCINTDGTYPVRPSES
ncbi:MAG: tail fiber protein [Bacteroidetes bacterium]|nr:tail fiber protein [Bacteroidota bacterium]